MGCLPAWPSHGLENHTPEASLFRSLLNPTRLASKICFLHFNKTYIRPHPAQVFPVPRRE
jgi:hypothetical protein